MVGEMYWDGDDDGLVGIEWGLAKSCVVLFFRFTLLIWSLMVLDFLPASKSSSSSNE